MSLSYWPSGYIFSHYLFYTFLMNWCYCSSGFLTRWYGISFKQWWLQILTFWHFASNRLLVIEACHLITQCIAARWSVVVWNKRIFYILYFYYLIIYLQLICNFFENFDTTFFIFSFLLVLFKYGSILIISQYFIEKIEEYEVFRTLKVI